MFTLTNSTSINKNNKNINNNNNTNYVIERPRVQNGENVELLEVET